MLRYTLKTISSIPAGSVRALTVSAVKFNDTPIKPNRGDVDQLFNASPSEQQPRRRQAFSVNRAEIIGGVTADPIIRQNATNNTEFASLQVATNIENRKANGEISSFTDYHNVLVFGRAVEFIKKAVNKGTRLYVTGRISVTDTVKDNGEKIRNTRIIADTVQLFGGSKRSE
uniref:Single-stranded DNA-binding protein n=1 Tax=Rhabditophanes sp. KR3021 TaxID=114890 RepID=A0AC35TH26_9BILA